MPNNEVPEEPIYLINFEEYLKPKNPQKSRPLQCFEAPPKRKSKCIQLYRRLKIVRWLRTIRLKVSQKLEELPLPSFLSFLRARNDDGLCKPKTGFEIYCEMSSIHGFHQFLGAKTWQRVLWWFVICHAVLLSLLVLIMSYELTAKTPTIRRIESMLRPSSERPLPFPAITICSLNRASQSSILAKSKEWQVTEQVLKQLPWITSRRLGTVNRTSFARLSLVNATWAQLLEELSPKLCEDQLLGCKWQGRTQSCDKLFATTWSYTEGRCCTSKIRATCSKAECTSAQGLSIRLATKMADYGGTVSAIAGFQLLMHGIQTTVNAATQRVMLPRGTESILWVKPFATYAASDVANLGVNKRRCTLPQERKLINFPFYTQDNCLAECYSGIIYDICGCVHPHMVRKRDWRICRVEEFQCLKEQEKVLDWNKLQSRCKCLPPSQFHRYELQSDIADLAIDSVMPKVNDKFFKNFNASDELVIHINHDSLGFEQLRMDVSLNWLGFLGNIGGITGLFMGCSFVSLFELIFFVCVRPTCNWLTRQQIRYRLRRQRQRQIAASQGN